ncbi:MAG: FapA family protein [Clostridium sp.]|nr:FapA family protein [Clostridium sp.]
MENQYGAKVENGQIIVNDNYGTENVTIKTCEGIELYVNGVKVSYGLKKKVTSEDDIRYTTKIINPERKMGLEISDDRLEARLIVRYKKGYTYKLVEKPFLKSLVLRAKKVELEENNQYKVDEIKDLLNKTKIKFGINISRIFQSVLGTDESGLIIAQGMKCIDDVPKRLELCIKTEAEEVDDDESKIINYRNRVILPNVEAGEVIARVIERIDGQNGEDIYGRILKKKSIKDPKKLVGEGCEIRGSEVIALYSGRPVFKSNMLTISKTLTLDSVNLKSGDVNFAGNVVINGRVESGSNINCGGFLEINGTVDDSKIVSNGDCVFKSAVVNSVALIGAYDVEKISYVNVLKEFCENIDGIINVSESIYGSVKGKSIGEVIEFLIEQRFKNINVLGMQIITKNIKLGIVDSSMLDFIRTKLLNMGALNIKSIYELDMFREEITNTIDDLSTDTVIELDTTLNYAQKCVIKATGNIVFSGMGSYRSKVYAFRNVVYENKDSICRGGYVESTKGNIKLGTVGSSGGVKTEVHCSNPHGIIEAETAYAGTVFIIGKVKYLVRDNIKNVKVYLGEDGHIVCESLSFS